MSFHAAERHYRGSTETVLNRVMSSYSTSIRAMIRERQQRSSPKIAPSIREKTVLVAMKHTPGNSRLLNAPKKISMLRDLCKSMGFDPIESSDARKTSCHTYLNARSSISQATALQTNMIHLKPVCFLRIGRRIR